jgi:hypothetical protein
VIRRIWFECATGPVDETASRVAYEFFDEGAFKRMLPVAR